MEENGKNRQLLWTKLVVRRTDVRPLMCLSRIITPKPHMLSSHLILYIVGEYMHNILDLSRLVNFYEDFYEVIQFL